MKEDRPDEHWFGGNFGSGLSIKDKSIEIVHEIKLDTDPECCPSQTQYDTWKLVDGVLRRTASRRVPSSRR